MRASGVALFAAASKRAARTAPALLALLVLAALAAGCRPAMTTTIENRGEALAIRYRCGDAMYEASLATGASTTFEPTANACTLSLDDPRPRRQLLLRNTCRAGSCSVGVAFPPGAGKPKVTLTGTGALEIEGDVAVPRPSW